MPRSGLPNCCSKTWSNPMGSGPPSRVSVWRSHAWISAGNGAGLGPGEPEDRDPVTPPSDLGIELHGPPLAPHEARGPGRPGDAVDRSFGAGGVSVPDRPEPP